MISQIEKQISTIRLQDEYVEVSEKLDEEGGGGVTQTGALLSKYHTLIDAVKAKTKKETMRSAKSLVTHALFPEILRPVDGKNTFYAAISLEKLK